MSDNTLPKLLTGKEIKDSKAKIESLLPTLPEDVQAYIKQLEQRLVTPGESEVLTIVGKNGDIKGFRRLVTLTTDNKGLVNIGAKKQKDERGNWSEVPGSGTPLITAQGYEMLNKESGLTIVYPPEILVNGKLETNPFCERNNYGRLVRVHIKAHAFWYSEVGLPMAKSRYEFYDMPQRRIVDLLSKVKDKTKEAFMVRPVGINPNESLAEKTWACYPFDDQINIWVNTSHNEAIDWISQINTREQHAVKVAQTSIERNLAKHMYGISQGPKGQSWLQVPIVCYLPPKGSIIQWDRSAYKHLQQQAYELLEGGENIQGVQEQIAYHAISSDEEIQALEAEAVSEEESENPIDIPPGNYAVSEGIDPKVRKQMVALLNSPAFESFFLTACEQLRLDPIGNIAAYKDSELSALYNLTKKLSEAV